MKRQNPNKKWGSVHHTESILPGWRRIVKKICTKERKKIVPNQLKQQKSFKFQFGEVANTTCLPLWGRCPSAHTGAERVNRTPSQSKIKDFCQLSQGESQGRLRRQTTRQIAIQHHGSISKAAKRTASSCREKGLSGRPSSRRSAVVIRPSSIRDRASVSAGVPAFPVSR